MKQPEAIELDPEPILPIIRIWYHNQWREAEVHQVMHDTIVVREPDHPSSLLNISRAQVNPLDLPEVPLPSCAIRVGQQWERVPVLEIGVQVKVIHEHECRFVDRSDIHPDDNRLMPLPPMD